MIHSLSETDNATIPPESAPSLIRHEFRGTQPQNIPKDHPSFFRVHVTRRQTRRGYLCTTFDLLYGRSVLVVLTVDQAPLM